MSVAAERRRCGVAARREVFGLVAAQVRAEGCARGGEVADRATRDVLVMLGLPPDEAEDICAQPLPNLDEVTGSEPAA